MPAMLQGAGDTEQDTAHGLMVLIFLRETSSEFVKNKHFRAKNIIRDKEGNFITIKM